MDEAIVCCDCPGIPQRARAAYKLKISPDSVAVFAGRSSVCSLRERLPSPSSIADHISACSRSKEKYAYYFKWDDKGAILRKYNLLTTSEVA